MTKPLIALMFSGSLALAQSSVLDYGAVGDGKADDTLAIQRASDACPGGAMTFPKGRYLASQIKLKNGCAYSGQPGSVLVLNSPDQFQLDASESSGISVSGLEFDGQGQGGAIVARGFAPATDLSIVRCLFRNVSSRAQFPANITVVSTWALVRARIEDNEFQNVASGIWATTVQDVSISRNVFSRVTQGDAIYLAPNPVPFPSGQNLVISGNSGTQLQGMGIEIFRPDPTNGSVLDSPLVQGNSFSGWTGSGSMGMSITHGDGAKVLGNSISNLGPGQLLGIEVIVKNSTVSGNYVSGNFAFGIVVQGVGPVSMKNNYVSGVFDSGILLACDKGRNRCSTTNSDISMNVVSDARLIGIKLDDDWTGTSVSRNELSRSAGRFPDDASVSWAGVHASPAPGPGRIFKNVVSQTSQTVPRGFGFCGFRLNAPMPGSYLSRNVVWSGSDLAFGQGVCEGNPGSIPGWTLVGNSFLNLVVGVPKAGVK